MLKRLDNKTIVVTGAASGIGRAVCSLALKEGARVIGVDTNFKDEENSPFGVVELCEIVQVP